MFEQKVVQVEIKNRWGGIATLFTDGTVACSGKERYGGDPGEKQTELTDVESLAATNGAFAAKKRDGRVVVWGHADRGGDAGKKQVELVDIVSLGSSKYAFAAMKRDGTFICWANEDYFSKAKINCQKVSLSFEHTNCLNKPSKSSIFSHLKNVQRLSYTSQFCQNLIHNYFEIS